MADDVSNLIGSKYYQGEAPDTGEADKEKQREGLKLFAGNDEEVMDRYAENAGGPMLEHMVGIYDTVRTLFDDGDILLEEGVDNPVVARNLANVDSYTFGAMNNIMAAGKGLEEFIQSGDFEKASEAYTSQADKINLAMEETREAYPAETLVGDIGGGAMSGLGLAVGGAKAFPRAAEALGSTRLGRAVGGMLAGATEEGLYEIGSSGELKEVPNAALYGALGSLIFSGGIAGAKGAKGLFKTIVGDNELGKQQVAMEMLDAMQTNQVKRGVIKPGEDFNVEAAAEELKQAGPDAVLSDIYPELIPYYRNAIRQGNPEARESFKHLLHVRNNIAGELDEVTRKTIKLPPYKNPKRYKEHVDEVHNKIYPRYEKIFKATDDSPYEALEVKDGIKMRLKGGREKETRQAMRVVEKVLKDNGLTRGPGPGGGASNLISLRGIHNAKRDVYEEIQALDRKDKGRRELWKVHDFLKDYATSVNGDYKKLNNIYGEAIERKEAFDEGYNMFGKLDTEPEDLERMARNMEKQGRLTSYIHGIKARLNKDLKKKDPKAQLKYLSGKGEQVKRLQAVLGKDFTDELLRTSQLYANKQEGYDIINKTIADPAAPMKGDILDYAAESMVAFDTGGAASKRATANLIRAVTGDKYAAMRARGELGAQVPGLDAPGMPRMLQELEAMRQRGSPDRSAVGMGLRGGAGGAFARGTEPDEEGESQTGGTIEQLMRGY